MAGFERPIKEKDRVAKMKMLKWMSGHTRKDNIQNDYINDKTARGLNEKSWSKGFHPNK